MMYVRMLKRRLKKPEELIRRYNKVIIKSIRELALWYDECEENPEMRNKELYYHPAFFRYKSVSSPGKSWYTFFKSLDDTGNSEICEKTGEPDNIEGFIPQNG